MKIDQNQYDAKPKYSKCAHFYIIACTDLIIIKPIKEIINYNSNNQNIKNGHSNNRAFTIHQRDS